MKKIIISLLVLCGVASAQPVSSGGLLKVAHDGTLTGTGTNPAPIGLTPCGSSGQTWVWNGSAFICASAGGVTNSAGNNIIPKSNGTNLVASDASDDGTSLIIGANKFTVTVANGNTAIVGTVTADGGNRVFDAVGTGLTRDGTNLNQVDLSLAGASCAAGTQVSAISATGTGTCSPDVTVVAAGTGISSSTVSGTANVALNINSGTSQTCGAGTAVTVLSGTGITTCSSFGSSSLTNSAGNNVITKSNGTNIVASGISDDGTTVSTSEAITAGAGLVTIGSGGLTSATGVNVIGHERGNVTIPTALGASQSDYTGCDSNTRICQLSASTTGVVITGFTGGAAGRIITLVNVGTNDITLNNEQASTAANQIKEPNALNWVVKPNCQTDIKYDATASRWRLASWMCANMPILSVDGNATIGSGASSSHVINGFADFIKTITVASLNQSGNIEVRDLAPFATGVGGFISFAGRYNTAGTLIDGAAIRAWKTNSTDGDNSFDLVFGTNNNPTVGGPQEWLRLTNTGHLDTKGTAPTLSTCGTSPSVIGNDKDGTVTIGTGGSASACTITFAGAYVTNAPPCVLTSMMSARTDLYISSISTTAFTVSNGAAAAFPASGKFAYHCFGTP